MDIHSQSSDDFPRYVIVEGPIGVGKTTLVEALAQRLNGRLMLEQFEDNPFLSKFYEDRKRYAFQTEVFFLLGRFRQQEAFAQEELFQRFTIGDYYFPKCRLFALLTLDKHEFQLFDQMYSILSRSLPTPDLIIYLHAPVQVLLERIHARGRSYEQGMDAQYLTQLSELYSSEFTRSLETPVISIDTTSIDFREEQHVDRLMQLIREGQTGRLEPQLFTAQAALSST
ncbi:MAG: deoxynucleoside kinase [Deltaproteobacteria bacterium]|nr:deoxynucleoside kinase [Deltaproteobacteria bacterium]|tara:strand:+ start:3590 stop:4270 length:681 start_codon:yes stop_codon:yes gene_type:complete